MLGIAVCDDERSVCDYLEKRCRDFLASSDMDAEITSFYDGNDLVKRCTDGKRTFDIIFLDIKMVTIQSKLLEPYNYINYQ